jgi:hypothetical protein
VAKYPLFWAFVASALLIWRALEVGQLAAAGKWPGLRDFLRLVFFAIYTVVYFSRYARLRHTKDADN